MTELSSMLVPLHTLSGWPAVTDPTVLQSLGLLIGFPALAFLIVFAVAKIGTVAQASNSPAPVTEPVWVGGRKNAELQSGTTEDTAAESDTAESGGGAGARW